MAKKDAMSNDDEAEPWKPYDEIENEIIEEVFHNTTEMSSPVELDDHFIDLNQQMQVSNVDNTKQHPIKRLMKSECNPQRLPRERFCAPLTSVPTTSRAHGDSHEWCPFIKQWIGTKTGKQCVFNVKECVRKAIEGILIEGGLHGKEIIANHLVRELKLFNGSTTYEASKICVHMFTRDTFLFRLVNAALRENHSSKVDTLGPYCYLLRAYIRATGTDYSGLLYRGALLSEEGINQYRHAAATREWLTWAKFTSTSKSSEVADIFTQNTMFTIDIKKMQMFLIRAFDIEHLSQYPEEQEVLLPAGVLFRVLDVNEDQVTNRCTIRLQV